MAEWTTDEVAARFEEAATTFLSTVRAIGPEMWDRIGALGDWNVRELTAHTMRAFITIEGYLGAEPTTDRVLADAAEYYNTVLADPDAHRHRYTHWYSNPNRGHAARHPDALREPLSFPPGCEASGGQVLPSLPGASHNQDGFFYARFRKA